MVNRPEISVLITSHNQYLTLFDAIGSVLAQDTDIDFEVIIVDDGSTDGSQQIIARSAAHDARIKPFYNQHQGIMATYATGFSNCYSKYIAICDGDDYWTDQRKLQKQYEYMERNAACGACFADVVDQRGVKICDVPDKISYTMLLRSGYPMTPTMFFRRVWLETYLDIKKRFYIWDYPLYLLIALYSRIDHIGEVMAVYRRATETFTCTRSRRRRLQYILGYSDIRFYFLRKYSYDGHVVMYLCYRFIRDIASLVLGRWNG